MDGGDTNLWSESLEQGRNALSSEEFFDDCGTFHLSERAVSD